MHSFGRIRRLVPALLVVSAFCWPNVAVASPIGGEPVIVASTGNVSATFLSGTASFSVDLYLDSPPNALGPIFNSQATAPGTQADLGDYAADTELIFRIHVNDTGDDFFSGPARRNADGIYHAVVDPLIGGAGVVHVGFEDLFGGGDRDFDDLQFVFTNTTVAPDTDGDGVSDAEEAGDANLNGIPDALEATVASVEMLQSYPAEVTLGQQVIVFADIDSVEDLIDFEDYLEQIILHEKLIREEIADAREALTLVQSYPAEVTIGQQVIIFADRDSLWDYINALERALQAVADDAQLASVDVQNNLQKVQQTLQMLSNISKMMHDLAMTIVVKIGSRAEGAPQLAASTGTTAETPTVVAMRFPPGVSANSYVNFGPTPDDPVAHAYEFLFDGKTGARFVPGGVLLYLVDGQRGDHDLTANGRITTEGGGVLVGGQPTRGTGYWKKHPTAWPLASLVLGDETYKQGGLLLLLEKATAKDASLNLAAQLIAAKLNIAHGSPAGSISETIEDADLLLAGLDGKLPYGVTKPSPVRRDMLALAKVLEAYNAGH